MLSKETVEHIAKLARLSLTLQEVGRFQKELSKILDYIEKLKEVDVSEVSPTSHSIRIENVLRVDERSAKRNTQSEKLMELAPETKNGYLKVKSIFK